MYVIHVRLKHGWQNIKINTLQECKVGAKLDGLLSSFLAIKIVLFMEFPVESISFIVFVKTFESKIQLLDYVINCKLIWVLVYKK